MHPTYTSQGAQSKESTCQAGDAGQFLGQEEPLEREMLIYSSVLAWNIPWREETGGLQFMWLQESDACMRAKSLQSCSTLCGPMDCSPPGSSVHGILQTRILEWVAMPSSRASSQPRDQTHISYVSYIGRRVLYR